MWMLTNANGYTMGQHNRQFSAIVIDHGRIVAVGDTKDLRLQYGARVEHIVDADGATVLPGFTDSHLHIAWLGMQMDMLDLTSVKSAEDVLTAVRYRADKLPEGAWVLGANWDENRFTSPIMPTPAQLDLASGGRPVLLRRVCGHVVLANRAAYECAGLGPAASDPLEGYFGRHSDGTINGYAYEGAAAVLESGMPKPTAKQLEQAVRTAMNAALAAGITAVHTEDVRHIGSLHSTIDIYRRLQRDGVRLRVHELVAYDYLDEYSAFLSDKSNDGDEFLQTGAVKLFSDGSLGGRTAYLSSPYSDAPHTTGTAIYTQEELAYRVGHVRDFGLPVAIHAIGDGALARVLDAIESCARVSWRDRIIHAEIVTPSLLERLASFHDGLIVDVQPRFAASDLPWVVQRLGEARMPYVCAWKSMLDAGLLLCGGSDAPVEPIAPLLGIHAAITRHLPGAELPMYTREQALTLLEAITLFTHGPSYAVHAEHEKGIIHPGGVADFTVIDTDITKPDNIDSIPTAKVLQTIVGGEISYQQ